MDPFRWMVVAAFVGLGLSFTIGLIRANRTINEILSEIDGLGDEVDSLAHAQAAALGLSLTPAPVSMPLTVTTIESPLVETLFPTDPASTGGLSVIEGEWTPDPNPPTVAIPPLPAPVRILPEAPADVVYPAKPKPSPEVGRPVRASELVARWWAEHDKAKGQPGS